MSIYNYLKRKKKIKIHKTNEYFFYEENKKTINKVLSFYDFKDQCEDFTIIRNNILIKAFQTKKHIHELIENEKQSEITEYLSTRPFLLFESEKVYLPQYSKALNYLYIHETASLKNYPYTKLQEDSTFSCINFFDEYGYDIFNSSFTNLLFIAKDKTSCAFYCPDFETIYIINDQGTLDNVIYLFDKYLIHCDKSNMLERCQNVVKEYYSNKQVGFIYALWENKLISSHMKNILMRKTSKRTLRRLKKHEVKNEKI